MLLGLREGLPLDPLPPRVPRDTLVPHAPMRPVDSRDVSLAIANALRYFPAHLHPVLGPEFLEELEEFGHVYMYRFRPLSYRMRAYPESAYPGKSSQTRAIQMMIMNNLDPDVAQYPHELVTYGGNGAVFSNWAQYHLVMQFLSEMEEDQTLVIYSGHPLGLFPSSKNAPRVVVTNGMMVPNYSTKTQLDRLYSLGVSQYGQMTAGSYCYIGPQGIVHGTTLTLMNASRKYFGSSDLRGQVYVSSGLGGMSGAQAKAAVIAGAIGVIAEVDPSPLKKRHAQGWVQEVADSLDACIERVKIAKKNREPLSLAYAGNVVDLLERLASEEELLVDLASDQTSLHNPYNGGYYPVQLSFDEAQKVMASDPPKFKSLVQESLRRHVASINKLVSRGMRFWDYGNCFLLEASRANADIFAPDSTASIPKFKYPSYVEHFMGDIFSLGFGPFRWICTSGDPVDLRETDLLAQEQIKKMIESTPPNVADQHRDNLYWIQHAEENRLVVGSQARILYSDAEGRVKLAVEFNKAIASGRIKGPIVLSRDHHDVSGTDSPFRETADVYDGSSVCAVHNFVGDSFRGATWIALHNGGGVGWGEVVNGGFGLVLDGSEDAERRARSMLDWDVNNGIARRAWAGNSNARFAIQRAQESNSSLKVTMANPVSSQVLNQIVKEYKPKV